MDMILALIIPALLLIGFACLWRLRPKPEFKTPDTKAFNPSVFYNFRVQKSLFVNASEHALYAVLYSQLSPKYRIFSKVRLEDIISVKPNRRDAKTAWALRGRVKSRHVDFLIASPQGEPLMMIELDGSSHKTQSAQLPDAFKDGLADAVGLPLRRIKVGQDFHKFSQKIEAEISRS